MDIFWSCSAHVIPITVRWTIAKGRNVSRLICEVPPSQEKRRGRCFRRIKRARAWIRGVDLRGSCLRTFFDCIDLELNEKGAVSDATLTRYRQVVADFLDGLGPVANQLLEAVTSEHVLKHREQLDSEGLAPATVNFTVKGVLKRAFKVANERVTTRNPCATVRLIQDRNKAAKHVFLPQQVSKLIETAEGDWEGSDYYRVLHGLQAAGFGTPHVVQRRPFAEQEGHSVHAEEDEGQDVQIESRNPDPSGIGRNTSFQDRSLIHF